MFERNVELLPPKKMSAWRKISFGSWRPVGDSSIYSSVTIPVEKAQMYVALRNINMHLFLIKALARAIERNPQINSVVRFGKLYPRKNVDIFYHVVASMKDAEDLSGLVMRSPQQKSWRELKKEFSSKVKDIKRGNDKSFDQIKFLFSKAPGMLSKVLLDLSSLIMYGLNLWSPLLGAPKDSFGSVMLTNIGSFGADNAFCPIAPYTKIPMVVSAGKIAKRPFVIGDQVKAVETIVLCLTFDHRIMDGVQCKWLMDSIEEAFETPEVLDSPEDLALAQAPQAADFYPLHKDYSETNSAMDQPQA